MTPPPQADVIHSTGFSPQVIRQLWTYIRPHSLSLFSSILLQLYQSVVIALGPYLVKVAMDDGIAAGSIEVLRNTVLLYIVLQLTQWGSLYLRIYLTTGAAQNITYELRERLFEHLQQLSLNFFSRYSVGRIITRTINDVNVVREFVSWTVVAIFRSIFTMTAIVITMLLMDVRLSLISFSVLPFMVIGTIIFRKYVRQGYRKVRSAIS